MQKISLDYLAGFIDGEGCFHISDWGTKKTNHEGSFLFILEVSSTDLEVLLAIQKEYGGRVREHKHKREPNRKKVWCWWVSGKQTIILSRMLKDKLIIKRRQAEIFSEMSIRRIGGNKPIPVDEVQRRKIACKEIKNLNQRNEGVKNE